MVEVTLSYEPQPKQALLHASPANEILFGGSAGPGKSMALRWEGFMWCMRIPNLQVYLFRRIFPELEKNHIIPSLMEFPAEVGKYKQQNRRWEFYNGSMLHFCHCQHENDVFQYQGAEIHLLLMDELTTFTELQYDYLRGRVRCTLKVPKKYKHKVPGIECASNPGGIGHGFTKRRWVDAADPYEIWKAPPHEGGMNRVYIPALLADNPILMDTDPEYIHRLDALPEPYRTAYKDGDWDIFLGQAFNFSHDKHVIKPIPVPDGAPLYMTFDWGYGAPFSVGWWWVDTEGRIYRFAEWYGWNGNPNEGIRMPDDEIADGILEREKNFKVNTNNIIRLAGPDCFNKKPDYRGGGQGPSTAEVFAGHGVILTVGDPSRSLKLRQFHGRLRIPEDDSPPMVLIYSTCEQFIRTIPLLQNDPLNVEDVDTNGEDHVFDESALLCMARPVSMGKPKKRLTPAERDQLILTGKLVEHDNKEEYTFN
jgi:hypothetical protein